MPEEVSALPQYLNLSIKLHVVEQYGAGYPRFTALLAAHEPWLIVRRFDRLRTRLLLLKQDRLSLLEQQLDQIDQQETAPLFLGQSRCDGNPDRLSTLSQIDLSMADYGNAATREPVEHH